MEIQNKIYISRKVDKQTQYKYTLIIENYFEKSKIYKSGLNVLKFVYFCNNV